MTEQLAMPPGPAMTTGTLALAAGAALWQGSKAGGVALEQLTSSILDCWHDLTADERAELARWARANRGAILRVVAEYVMGAR